MRNMSFSMTEGALLAGRKTVTRRLGWRFLEPGDQVCAVRKGMGLRKGEKVKRLAHLEVVRVTREPLDDITSRDVIREGYPGVGPRAFVDKFCSAMHCVRDTTVTRIEFRVLSFR